MCRSSATGWRNGPINATDIRPKWDVPDGASLIRPTNPLASRYVGRIRHRRHPAIECCAAHA
ncbi:hypothetical protein EH164_16545 [Kosakonia sp. CCTCC M2018092]|nr:hypothetical protein EH164_16545 [Kosakonia sp. CCTCC M2018092]